MERAATLVIHIGPPAAGGNALQALATLNAFSLLRDHRTLYPLSLAEPFTDHNQLAWLIRWATDGNRDPQLDLTRYRAEPNAASALDGLRRSLDQLVDDYQVSRVLLSAEDLAMVSPDAVRALAQLTSGYRRRVLVSYRPRVAVAEEQYISDLLHGYSGSLSAFLSARLVGYPPFLVELVRTWSDVMEEVRIVPGTATDSDASPILAESIRTILEAHEAPYDFASWATSRRTMPSAWHALLAGQVAQRLKATWDWQHEFLPPIVYRAILERARSIVCPPDLVDLGIASLVPDVDWRAAGRRLIDCEGWDAQVPGLASPVSSTGSSAATRTVADVYDDRRQRSSSDGDIHQSLVEAVASVLDLVELDCLAVSPHPLAPA